MFFRNEQKQHESGHWGFNCCYIKAAFAKDKKLLTKKH